jgi:hypothetical protein
MEKSELAPVITQLCDLQLQQFQFGHELLIQIVAIREVMKDQGYRDFESEFQKKTLQLKQGALGQEFSWKLAAFGQELDRVKSLLL